MNEYHFVFLKKNHVIDSNTLIKFTWFPNLCLDVLHAASKKSMVLEI